LHLVGHFYEICKERTKRSVTDRRVRFSPCAIPNKWHCLGIRRDLRVRGIGSVNYENKFLPLFFCDLQFYVRRKRKQNKANQDKRNAPCGDF
jgi:hypothetical protein